MGPKKDEPKEAEEEPQEEEEEDPKKAEIRELTESWFKKLVAEKKRLKEEKAAQAVEDQRKERLRRREEIRQSKEREKRFAKEREKEDEVKLRVDMELRQLQEEKDRRQKPAQMPHLVQPRPLWITYAPEAPFHERMLVRGLVRGLHERGMKGDVWLDTDEGSAFPSMDHALERCEALAEARMAVVLVSPAYFASPAGRLECDMMRTRVMGGYGDDLVVLALEAAPVEVPAEYAEVLGPVMRIAGEGSHWVEAALETMMDPMSSLGWWVGDDVTVQPGTEDKVRDWVEARSRPLPFVERTILSWTSEETVAWLESQGKGLAQWCALLRAKHIDGFVLPWATDGDLAELGISDPVARARIMEKVGDEASRAVHEPPRDLTSLSHAELEDLVMGLFVAADKDGNGVLSPAEFKAVMKGANLGLSSREVRAILSECDANDDGLLSYREFLPIMVELVANLKAKREAHEMAAQADKNARLLVGDMLLRGLPREALEGAMGALFKRADVNSDGTLSRKEFQKCLRSADLGLTRKNINMLMAEVDANQDGLISYEEFLPLCFSILVEKMKDDIIAHESLQSAEGIERLLLESFFARAQRDAEAGGGGDGGGKRLALSAVKECLFEVSGEHIGLTRLQIMSIMSEANASEAGLVDFVRFAGIAAGMIHVLFDADHQKLRAEAIAVMSDSEGAQMLVSRSREEVEEIVMGAFQMIDREGKGWLDRVQVAEVMTALGPRLQLGHRDYNALMAAIDENNDGVVDYGELVSFVYDCLVHLRREQYIDGVAEAAKAREEAAAMAAMRPETPMGAGGGSEFGVSDVGDWESNAAAEEISAAGGPETEGGAQEGGGGGGAGGEGGGKAAEPVPVASGG